MENMIYNLCDFLSENSSIYPDFYDIRLRESDNHKHKYARILMIKDLEAYNNDDSHLFPEVDIKELCLDDATPRQAFIDILELIENYETMKYGV